MKLIRIIVVIICLAGMIWFTAKGIQSANNLRYTQQLLHGLAES
jgi:hypothetical protein